MASEQQPRRENTNSDREVHVEKDRVPKMASRFESLAEKARELESDITGGKVTPHWPKAKGEHDIDRAEVAAHFVEKPRNQQPHSSGGKEFHSIYQVEVGAGGNAGAGRKESEKVKSINVEEGGTEEVKRADKAGEERGVEGGEREEAENQRGIGYEEMRDQEREVGKITGRVEEEGSESQQPSLEEISKLRALAQQNSMDTLTAAEERYNKAMESASQGVGSVSEYASEKASHAKDTILHGARATTQYVAEKGAATKDIALEKSLQGYEAAKNYTVPKAEQAKDYTVQKASEAKDMAVDTGKSAAEYTGKAAADVKDKAVEVGWGVAHYTTEKTVEGTKLAARVVEGVAGKVGEVVAGAGHKAAEMAAKPLSAAKEAAISTGESVIEYTARKREEAHRDHKARKLAESQGTEWTDKCTGTATEEAEGITANAQEVEGRSHEGYEAEVGEAERPQGITSKAQEMGGGGGGTRAATGAVGEILQESVDTAKMAGEAVVEGARAATGKARGMLLGSEEGRRTPCSQESGGITEKTQGMVGEGARTGNETVGEIFQESGNLAREAGETVLRGARAAKDAAWTATGTVLSATGKAGETLLGSEGMAAKTETMVGQGAKVAAQTAGEIFQESENLATRAGDATVEGATAAGCSIVGGARVAKDTVGATIEKGGEMLQVLGQHEEKEIGGGGLDKASQQQQEQGGGSLLGAIGETIVEIAHTTTNIVAGPPGHKPGETAHKYSHAGAEER